MKRIIGYLYVAGFTTGAVLQTADPLTYPWALPTAEIIGVLMVAGFFYGYWDRIFGLAASRDDAQHIKHENVRHTDHEFYSDRAIRNLLVTWMIVLAALACLTCIFGFLAATAAGNGRCAGLAYVAGYRNGAGEFLAFPLLSSLVVVAFVFRLGRLVFIIRDTLTNNNLTVFEFGPIRVTYGMFLLSFGLVGFVLFSGLMSVLAARRYFAIIPYCGQ
jgi:hypothetical protein